MLELQQKTGIATAVHYRKMTGVAKEFQTIAKDIRCLETQVFWNIFLNCMSFLDELCRTYSSGESETGVIFFKSLL